MTTLGIVQARFGSSRLPGKVLQPIGETSMLEKVLRRLSRARSLDALVVATTDTSADDAVAIAAAAVGVPSVRGSEFDVLDRFHQALAHYPDADCVVRVTADCPFIDPEEVDRVVAALRTEGADFAANRLPPPNKRTYPVGLDVEAATRAALDAAWRDASAPHHREHVMPFLYETPERFRTTVLQLDEDLSSFRWTVDTREDLEAARRLDALAGPEPFSWRRVLAVARAHPDIGALNAAQSQKYVTDVDDRWRRQT